MDQDLVSSDEAGTRHVMKSELPWSGSQTRECITFKYLDFHVLYTCNIPSYTCSK